jgi:hypothetical protein
LKVKIIGFHILSRKYFIDVLTNVKSKTKHIGDEFNKIYKKNNGDHVKSFSVFENDSTVRKLVDDLNESYPNWSVKKEILEVILRKIESIIPEDFSALNQIKQVVLDVCDEAKIDERKHFGISNEMQIEICKVEKEKFYYYVNGIAEEDLLNVAPLFYRVVLSENKISDIKKKINEICYNSNLEKETSLCFKVDDFQTEVSLDRIVDALTQHEISKIYEINTGGIGTVSYSMDLYAFDPYYIDGCNIYWCTDQLDWLIVKEHEGYYFIYGEWLMHELKKVWKDWDQRICKFK